MDEKILDKLRQISLFNEIKSDESKLTKVYSVCTPRFFKAGSRIIQEGETGDEMFIIISGSVEILKKTRAGDNYTVVRLKAEHNIFIGELALIDDDTRSATVIASEDSEFMVIKKKDFLDLGNSSPDIGLPITRAIAKILAGRLRKTTQDMLILFDALVTEIQEE